MCEMKKKDNENLGVAYLEELSKDKRYSLEVDSAGHYNLDEQHKLFIYLYSHYENLKKVCELMEIEEHLGRDYLLRYATQQELRRLNLARYHRRIATNMISYQDLGSYMSSLLISDVNTEGDKLSQSNKLQLIRLMMDWHKGMLEFTQHPEELIHQSVEEELEELKASDIKELLQKKKLITSIGKAEEKVKGSTSNLEGAFNEGQITKSLTQEDKLSRKDLIKKILSTGEFNETEVKFIKSLTIKELKELIT